MPKEKKVTRSHLQSNLYVNTSAAAISLPSSATLTPPIVENQHDLESPSIELLQQYYNIQNQKLKQLMENCKQLQPNTAPPPSSASLKPRTLKRQHHRTASSNNPNPLVFIDSMHEVSQEMERIFALREEKIAAELKINYETIESQEKQIQAMREELEQLKIIKQEQLTAVDEMQKERHRRHESEALLRQLQGTSDALMDQTIQKENRIIEEGCKKIKRDIHAASTIKERYESIDSTLQHARSKLVNFSIWLSHYALKCCCTNSPRKEQLTLIEETATMLKTDNEDFNKILDHIAKSIKLNPTRTVNTAALAAADGKDGTAAANLLDIKQALSIKILTKALIMFGCLEKIRLEIIKENKLAPSRLEEVIKLLQMSLERHIFTFSGGINIQKRFHTMAEQAYKLLTKHRDREQNPTTENASVTNSISLDVLMLPTDTPSLLNQGRALGRI